MCDGFEKGTPIHGRRAIIQATPLRRTWIMRGTTLGIIGRTIHGSELLAREVGEG